MIEVFDEIKLLHTYLTFQGGKRIHVSGKWKGRYDNKTMLCLTWKWFVWNEFISTLMFSLIIYVKCFKFFFTYHYIIKLKRHITMNSSHTNRCCFTSPWHFPSYLDIKYNNNILWFVWFMRDYAWQYCSPKGLRMRSCEDRFS